MTSNFQDFQATKRQRHQAHSKMEYCSVCLDIQLWVKKVQPFLKKKVYNRRIHQIKELSEFQRVVIGIAASIF